MPKLNFILVMLLIIILSSNIVDGATPLDKPRAYLEIFKQIHEFFREALRYDESARCFIFDKEKAISFLKMLVQQYADDYAQATGVKIDPDRAQRLVNILFEFITNFAKKFTDPEKRGELVTLFKDLLLNQFFLTELLKSEERKELIYDNIINFINRFTKLVLECKPAQVTNQLILPARQTGDIRIVPDKFILIADLGTSGHLNRAIDAGETIALNITLKNSGNRAYRSTSGFLDSDDPYVTCCPMEVIYDVQPKTPTVEEWPPGTQVTPKENYLFYVAPNCPDQHVAKFRLLIWDTEWGRSYQKFSIKIYNVGPLAFGDAKIDDDIPGRSEGDADGLMEPGETIEFVLDIKNEGEPTVSEVTATLFADADFIDFREPKKLYPPIPGKTIKGVLADFDFKVLEEEKIDKEEVIFRLLTVGKAYGFDYAWSTPFSIQLGLSEEQRKRIRLKQARIAFQSNRDGNEEIYVMNTNGSNQINITNNPADDLCPSWSPDGTRIAFTSDRDGDLEIYVMNADGSEQRRLTNNPADDASPSWSPDGTRIAFQSDRDGNGEIYVMNADGSNQRNITNNPAYDGVPSWSPDGTWIAFTSSRDGDLEIYVMNADGSEQRRLTNNPTWDWCPSWLPR